MDYGLLVASLETSFLMDYDFALTYYLYYLHVFQLHGSQTLNLKPFEMGYDFDLIDYFCFRLNEFPSLEFLYLLHWITFWMCHEIGLNDYFCFQVIGFLSPHFSQKLSSKFFLMDCDFDQNDYFCCRVIGFLHPVFFQKL